MENTAVIVAIVVVLAVAIGVAVFVIVRKQRYVRSIRQRGWEWVERPALSITVGLNHPPFGIGFRRSVDDQVIGSSTSGTPFQAFRYKADGFSSSGYVVAMPLPRPLPEFYSFPAEAPRALAAGATISPGPLVAVAPDAAFGHAAAAAMTPALTRPLADGKGRTIAPDVSVDHDQLVLLHVPRPVEDLAAAVEWLAEVHRGLVDSPAAQFTGPPPPAHLSFHNRDHWHYSPRDDNALHQVNHTRGGHGHRAEDVIRSDNFGLPFIRLTHRWETTETRTNAKGETETYTKNHEETLCEFATTFGFHPVSVNWGMFGNKVRFESADFNRQFTVRCTNPKFASDVFHPRQLEYLLRTSPIPFSIEADRRIRVASRDWLPDEIEWFSTVLRGFFARVPDFVWRDLGSWPRPIPRASEDV